MAVIISNSKTSRKQAIVILGMHRSGTSALSRTVNLLGAQQAINLMAAQEDNPLGFWEPKKISDFNENLLVASGRSWDDPKPLATEWLASNEREKDIQYAIDLIKNEYPNAGLFVLKDPRMSRLMPIWTEAFKRLDIAPTFLISCRNPLEVADSLAKRNNLSYVQSQLLWLTYMLEAERTTRESPRAIVHYDKLIKNWRLALKQAFEVVGHLSLSDDQNNTTLQLDEFLDERHRHQQATDDMLNKHPGFSDLVKILYQTFTTNGDGLNSTSLLDHCHYQLISAWHLFSPNEHEKSIYFTKSHEKSNIPQPTPVLSPNLNSSKNLNMAITAPRRIILHYHFFKNAGTSIDKILKSNFGNAWREKEGSGGKAWHPNEISQFLSATRLTVFVRYTSLRADKCRIPKAQEWPSKPIFAVMFAGDWVVKTTALLGISIATGLLQLTSKNQTNR